MAEVKYYSPSISINAPAHNSTVPGSFTVSGTASCELLKDIPGESGIFISTANEKITSVRVTIGTAAAIEATPTGPPDTPWTSWTFQVSGKPSGPLPIKAEVTASGSGGNPGSKTDSLSVTIDATPPTFAINPPADVVQPAPPYIATITGTAADSAAGVAAVEWQFGSTSGVATGTTNWTAQVPLPELGLHTVTFRARDNMGNQSAPKTTQVRVGDVTPPSLSITDPKEPLETFPLVNGHATIVARGTASDTQTGVAKVEWSLNDQTGFTLATPKAANDWSTWTAQVSINTGGTRMITVRATDKAGNMVKSQRAFDVAEPVEPQDAEAHFSPTAYLDELLNYSTKRVKTSATDTLTRQMLVDNYLQPFIDLVTRANRAVANQSVSQVRLCIECLRRYLSKNVNSASLADEASYRQSAYGALLLQLGTSYEEIRLARVADQANQVDQSKRLALANRLGIAVNRLEQLYLPPADLTEVALRNLFGLEETTLKPLAESFLPEANLLIWQKENLRSAWQQQDDAARSELDLPTPVIDPDLLSTKDLRAPSAGTAAYDLWKARREELAAQLTELDTTRKGQATQLAGFDLIVSKTLGPVEELLKLNQQRESGVAIDIALGAKRLTLQPFLHLMRVRKLAEQNSLLDAEWSDVYAILIQVKKLGLYATWRVEERQRGLILGPDSFQLTDSAPSQDAPLPRWRATPGARQAWRRTLEARIQQELTLTQAMQSAVSAAEEATLPLLRQACIAAIAAIAGVGDVGVIADRLTEELGIDCQDSGHVRTTRAQQALETLQSVLLSLRTGRLKNAEPVLGASNPAANWVLVTEFDPNTPYTEADFDEEWRWMGGYTTWNAAMRVFAYPESFLLPELRPTASSNPNLVPTAAYREFMKQLRDQTRLTAEKARELAQQTYLKSLTDDLDSNLPASLHHPTFVITEQLTDTQLAMRRRFIAELFGTITNPSLAPNYLQEIFYFVPMALALQLQKSGQYLVALDWIETFYTDHFALADRKIYRGLMLEEKLENHYQRNPDNWLRVGLNPHDIATTRANAHSRFTLMTLVRCYLDFADAEFTRDDGESIARARALYATALDLLALPEPPPVDGSKPNPYPPNPVPQALKARAELNLFKLRTGRNIAGLERNLTPLTQPALMLDRLPTAGDPQRLFRPTPYRYGVLIERAKNLVSIAQQVEQAFLAALEKRDAEVYNLLKAGHDLQLAGATVNLQALRVQEAQQGVGLAEQQLNRAAIQRDTYQGWIDAGLNQWEDDMLDDYREARKYRNYTAGIDAALTVAQTLAAVESGGFLGTGLGAGWGGTLLVGGLALAKSNSTIGANNAETSAQINSAKASFERRQQEWELQRQLAESDIAIGQQQVTIAHSHTDVARQEEFISRIQHEQAQATVDFLAHKFTSAELYAWMSGVLGGAYNYFLQQATAVAQLAQHQLGFERQETPPAFIKADYWNITDEGAAPAGSASAQPDRQGLTGSVRLLQDITRLDQFAFDTNRRKLQLAETFSLARLFPMEFQQFRESGRLPFATPMSIFDRGFPGHYLRLIKRVRMSIVALVPPVRGVRATLISSGISRVVTGGDVFQSILVRRDPELIAFTSPSNATGLIDLEPETGMLLPFESMGVDTNWELQLPKAANPFDYRSISDVLLTVEYTALQDFSYRKQVIQGLEDTVIAERAFSVREQFADQWYALHNPGATTEPMAVPFTLTRQDFPPNLDDLRIEQVMLAVVRAPGRTFEISGAQLLLTAPGATTAIGGTAGSSIEGVISTRRSNAGDWTKLIGKSPAGAWELMLPNTQEMKDRFKNGEIEDLLLVLTYAGRTPAWPM